jgi:hypothetical protein
VLKRKTRAFSPEEQELVTAIQRFVRAQLPHLTENQRRVVVGKVYREMRRRFKYVRTEPKNGEPQ